MLLDEFEVAIHEKIRELHAEVERWEIALWCYRKIEAESKAEKAGDPKDGRPEEYITKV